MSSLAAVGVDGVPTRGVRGPQRMSVPPMTAPAAKIAADHQNAVVSPWRVASSGTVARSSLYHGPADICWRSGHSRIYGKQCARIRVDYYGIQVEADQLRIRHEPSGQPLEEHP